MTLHGKITLTMFGLGLGFASVSGVALWGLRGIREHLRLARDEYTELRMFQNAAFHAAAAKARLQAAAPDDPTVQAELEARDDELNAVLEMYNKQDQDDPKRGVTERAATMRSFNELREALEQLHSSSGDPAGAVGAIEHVLTHLAELAAQMDSVVATAQREADGRLDTTIAGIAILSGVILLGITWVNVTHYRSIVGPLDQLRQGVDRMAGGEFSTPVHVDGAEEFVLLAGHFNRMAGELDHLYRTLQAQVEAKSRELVRSERLASVGHLAAGVAHEINNPLNIISAHTELTLKRLGKAVANVPPEQLVETLRIIRDESFRCKEIIDKLLSLSRFGDSARERVCVATIVNEVVSLVAVLKQIEGRRLTLRMEELASCTVWGNASELKQVLLNIVLNALEAVQPGEGEVRVEGRAWDTWIELTVRDNGRGMAAETLQHVFEPFFTDRRGGDGRGLGLGLSITHAIVEAHGGRISAESDGLGHGSVFRLRLPKGSEISDDDRRLHENNRTDTRSRG